MPKFKKRGEYESDLLITQAAGLRSIPSTQTTQDFQSALKSPRIDTAGHPGVAFDPPRYTDHPHSYEVDPASVEPIASEAPGGSPAWTDYHLPRPNLTPAWTGSYSESAGLLSDKEAQAREIAEGRDAHNLAQMRLPNHLRNYIP